MSTRVLTQSDKIGKIMHMQKLHDIQDKINHLLVSLPGHVLIKDTSSRYIAASDGLAQLFGFEYDADLPGKTDWDKRCNAARRAPEFIAEDHKLLRTGRPIYKVGHFDYNTEEPFSCIYHKWLLRDEVGIPQAIVVFNQALYSSPADNEHTINFFNLSAQQIRCLRLLIRGYTYVEISRMLSLSPRTVESYINEIKAKMSCKKKSQLITTALQLGYSP